MITAVHHIALIISKEEHLDFYRLLGFQESFRKERKYDVAVGDICGSPASDAV